MAPVLHPKMIWSRVALTLGALLVGGFHSARAQDVAVDSFLPSPDQSGFVGFASTRTPGP
jgi:hypothetical protein